MSNPYSAATTPPIIGPPLAVDALDPAERRREIAHLLAIAYWRLQAETTERGAQEHPPQSDLTGAPGRA